jgi:hypothetical protein
VSIFGNQTQAPTRINQVQINQSVLGYALAVVMGCAKIQQTILWIDGFVQSLITTGGGKGISGGKDGNQYVYTADVIAGLCAGDVTGIGDIWSGQTWLSNTAAVETYTITGGTPVYTPLNASALTADTGVSVEVSQSGSYNDLGSGAPTVISNTSMAAFTRVAYGVSLTSGQYSINPTTSAYSFSSADAGRTIQIQYSFALGIVKKQDKDLIPESRVLTIDGDIPFYADGGVMFYQDGGTDPDNGVPLRKVSGSPTVSGTYSQDPGSYSTSGSPGSETVTVNRFASYTFAAADINKEVMITYEQDNTSAIPQGTATSVNFTLYEGTQGQQAPALLVTNFPGAALGYSGIALAAYFPMDLGYSAEIQQNTFETFTADGWGGGIVDCSPVRCILQVLGNTVWGLGAGPVPFPVSALDIGAGGTWGNPTQTGAARADGTATSWFAANGFFISPAIDRQDTAASVIGEWLEAGQCPAFMSEGLLKLVPYGDTTTAGNGVTWVAPSEFVVALDDTCFIPKSENEDPVKLSVPRAWQDAYPTVQVQWNNRQNQYASEITPESDQAAINRFGNRVEDPQTWDFITTLPSAVFAASMRVKRLVYIRNSYEFTLSYRYSYLEPMDVVYITTSSSWAVNLNNENLNVVSLPVRITKIVDNPDGTLDFECEDYPFGVHEPTIYNKGLSLAEAQPNKFADPGNSEVVIFEATSRLTGFQGNQIWIGALGISSYWGSCNVLASMDGDKYVPLGTIRLAARLGELGAALPSGSDPDTAHSLVVDLAENSNMLESATMADADINNTLCFVDGELISYSACSVTGVNRCTATGYMRRGQMGSTIGAHAAGSLFMRLDNAVFKYTYDPSWYGKTVFLKFQSVNIFGNSAQDPSTLTPVEFVIPGLNGGTVDASSGLVISQYLPPNVATNVASNAILSSAYDTTTGTSSISAYGPAGAGTSWTYTVGTDAHTYPAATLTGVPPTTGIVYVAYDTLNGAYTLIPASSYQNALNDFYIVLGSVTVASATTGSGGTIGGAGGGGYGCTVGGTPLDTPDGPVDNRVLKMRLDAGEAVYLSGRFGPEQILAAEWVDVTEVYWLRVGVRPAIYCSASHMLRVCGHYQMADSLGHINTVETRTGYEPVMAAQLQLTGARVLRISLAGPSHEYSVYGVMTHNIKAPFQPINLSPPS